MSRTHASAIALFAASALVFAAAVFLTFGPIAKPARAPMTFDAIEPQAGSPAMPAREARPVRIESDMTATIRRLEGMGRLEGMAGPEAGPQQPVVEMPTRSVAGNDPISAPASAATAAGPAPAALRSAEPARRIPATDQAPAARVQDQATQRAETQRTETPRFAPSAGGSEPISLMPWRGTTGSTGAAERGARPAPDITRRLVGSQESGFRPGIAFQPGALAVKPSYSAAPTPLPGQGPSFIPHESADEANLTAEQLNERELLRIRKWREAQGAGAQ